MDISPKMIEDVVKQVVQQMANGGSAPAAPAKSAAAAQDAKNMTLTEVGNAVKGTNPREVVIGIAPAYGKNMHATITRIPHSVVLREIISGIEEEGCVARVVRITRTSDVGSIGSYASKLSGSGIGIGLQSKGTIEITQSDLYPLTNLELFPLAPLVTAEKYRAIGSNAAKYAKNENPNPVPVVLDQTVLPVYQPIAVLMHNRETSDVTIDGPHLEVQYSFSK